MKNNYPGTGDAYNRWSKSYDIVDNKTRDLEAKTIRTVLNEISCQHIIEIGCGTGKNTSWLAQHCQRLTAIDFSEEMLKQAKEKIKDPKIEFQHADITIPWRMDPADLISCSLVLEHIDDLSFIFEQAALSLTSGGQFYICELHPYKQMQGSRARFEEGDTTIHLEYFVHHISEYMAAAFDNGFTCISLLEWFDNNHKDSVPRLVSYLFRKI